MSVALIVQIKNIHKQSQIKQQVINESTDITLQLDRDSISSIILQAAVYCQYNTHTAESAHKISLIKTENNTNN